MQKHLKRLAQSQTFTKIVLPIILIAILAIIGFTTFGGSRTKTVKPEEAKQIAENFINDFLMMPGSKAQVTEIIEEYNLYKLTVDITSDIVESYLSKDGKVFFPQAFNIEEMQAEAGITETDAPPAVDIPKNAKPNVELFVMSHCPYGVQIEKGILPVVNLLGDKIDFELKFVDYAMRAETELNEQMIQYCIQKEQNDKFLSYLECFVDDGDTNRCLTAANIEQANLDSCVETVDNEFKITENFNNNVGFQGSFPSFNIHKTENDKYGVTGSPTLVINGTSVQSGRSAASLLATICSAFDVAPEECNASLPSETPSPGFGAGTTNSAAAPQCG